jgi:hypothetical protein
MSVEVVPGGQRRIDRVLDPPFTDRVDRLGCWPDCRPSSATTPPGTFSAVPRVQVPSRAGEHRRRVERLVSDETIARLPEPYVEELTRAVELLAREEERVSTHRRAVQRVLDVLRGELARRYRDGTAQVSQLIK